MVFEIDKWISYNVKKIVFEIYKFIIKLLSISII